MSSLFRSRHRRGSPDDERGSGGKILRGRRPAPPASPYQRPALPPSPSAPRSPSWISGIFSSAGKLISTVFGEASSSEDEAVSISSEDGNDTSVEDLPALNQRGKEQEIIRDHGGLSSAIVPKSESKLVIEQLLKQETFSRDECKRLMEILQSRVVDCPSTEDGEDPSRNEIPCNTSGNAISTLGGYQSLNQSNELQDAFPHSPNALNSFSPGLSARQNCEPDLRATAIMEAKKWLEEKKLSTSKANFDCGPCILNTDALHYDTEDEMGSPVDMAKSYMQSLPPWQSPLLNSIGFKTTSPSAGHSYTDHALAINRHSSPSSKAPKRSYFAIEPWNTPDEVRRVRTKAKSSLLDSSSERHLPSTGLLDHEASAVPSAAAIRDSEDHCSNRAISLLNENGNEENHSNETCGVTSVSIVPKLSEAPEANQSTMTTILLPNQAVIGSEPKLSDTDTPILSENQDVEEPSEAREANNRFLLPSGSPVLPSEPMEQDGDPLSRTTTLFLGKTKPTDPSDANVATLDLVYFPAVRASSGDREKLPVGKSSKSTSLEETTHDSRPQDGNYNVQNETEQPYREITVNGAPAEYNKIESMSSKGVPVNSNTSEPLTEIREGSFDIINNSEGDVLVHASNSTEPRTTVTPPGVSHRGKKAIHTPNSTEPRTTKTPSGPRSSRGKKAVHTPSSTRPRTEPKKTKTPPGKKAVRDPNSTEPKTTETPPGASRRGKKAAHDPNSTEPKKTETPPGKKAVHDPNSTEPKKTETPPGTSRRGKKAVHDPNSTEPKTTETPSGKKAAHDPNSTDPKTTETPPGASRRGKKVAVRPRRVSERLKVIEYVT